jgi:hypothetical protein
MMGNEITRSQRVLLIAGHAGSCPETADRYLSGKRIRGEALRARLAQAEREVNQKHPPQQPGAGQQA